MRRSSCVFLPVTRGPCSGGRRTTHHGHAPLEAHASRTTDDGCLSRSCTPPPSPAPLPSPRAKPRCVNCSPLSATPIRWSASGLGFGAVSSEWPVEGGNVVHPQPQTQNPSLQSRVL